MEYDFNLEKIKSSAIFMSILSPKFVEEPRCVMQIGAAVLLDKPIAIIVVKGAKVPKHLEKIATIEYCNDLKDMERATSSLIKKMKKAGHIGGVHTVEKERGPLGSDSTL